MIDDETRRCIERDLEAMRPFTEIAARHGVGFVDVALVHNRMRPQPPGWPEQIPAVLWEEVAEALRRDDLARIAAGDDDPLLRTVYELDAEERHMTGDADRERLARLVIRKGLDRTIPHPELRPCDFIAAWLDGEVRLEDLRERMGLTRVQLRRLRLAAAEAVAAELGRLAVEKEALAELGRSTDDLVEATRRRDED